MNGDELANELYQEPLRGPCAIPPVVVQTTLVLPITHVHGPSGCFKGRPPSPRLEPRGLEDNDPRLWIGASSRRDLVTGVRISPGLLPPSCDDPKWSKCFRTTYRWTPAREDATSTARNEAMLTQFLDAGRLPPLDRGVRPCHDGGRRGGGAQFFGWSLPAAHTAEAFIGAFGFALVLIATQRSRV